MTSNPLDPNYHTIIDRVLKDKSLLPSLPDIAFKIRGAITEETTTVETLTAIIAKDPALTAHLIKSAASPIYRRQVPPKTLAEVIGLVGFSATSSLIFLYCTRNMLVLKNDISKMLFSQTWERLVTKTAIASFLAQKLDYHTVDQVQMAMLLTEVGSLSVLSAMIDNDETPDTDVYFQVCRGYSKSLGCILLDMWKVDESIINISRQCGHWQETWEDKLNLLDIANLALYYTVLHTVDNASLPALESLAAFKKIPTDMAKCSKPNWLSLITDNQDEIKLIINTFK